MTFLGCIVGDLNRHRYIWTNCPLEHFVWSFRGLVYSSKSGNHVLILHTAFLIRMFLKSDLSGHYTSIAWCMGILTCEKTILLFAMSRHRRRFSWKRHCTLTSKHVLHVELLLTDRSDGRVLHTGQLSRFMSLESYYYKDRWGISSNSTSLCTSFLIYENEKLIPRPHEIDAPPLPRFSNSRSTSPRPSHGDLHI